ncbi:MAG: hypothetical protein NT013_03975, partial [Planctomycetia bacterium]|nr:hypothetical protein [Planctomycetia bacterium]
MSTATASERSHAPYAEPDEYIDYQLRKTQVGIKRTDMLTAGVVAITVLIGYVLLFVLSDHWLFDGGVGNTARVLMFLPVIGFVGWLIGAKVILPSLKNVNGLYAAKTLEASSTEFHSSLLNLIDLKQAGRDVSPMILATMEKRAAVTLSKLNIDDAIDKRPLLRTLYVLFTIVVAFCLYSVLSPKQLGPSVLRAIAPFTNVTPATQTEILEVKPGNAKLRAGGSLPIEVHLRGEMPSKVTLHYTTADRRFVDEPLELSANTEPQHFEGLLGEDGQGLLQSFAYYVVAGDARSPEYRVTIITPPSATITEQRYQYPEYMELDPRTQHGGVIDVWERTAVSISGTTNIPIKRAELEFADTEDFSGLYPGPSVKIEEGKKLAINWRAEPRHQDNKFPKFYRVKVWDDEGNPDPKPTVYPVNVRIDQAPQVALLDPTASLEMPANGIVPLAVAARDLDFKLRTVTLKIARADDDITDEPLFDGAQQEVGVKHDFALELLKLKTGDKIKFWIEAQDNRLPTHNLAKTEPLEITIVEKITKEEAKKQLNDKKQEQDKKLKDPIKPENNPNDQQQPLDDGQMNHDVVLVVRLFDEETNQPLDVNRYARAMGLREPLFRGYVLSDIDADGQWVVSTREQPDGDRRAIQAARQKLTIRQEIVQQPNAEVLDPGILHVMPLYGDCRLDQGRVAQGSVNSSLYREKVLPKGKEMKYVVNSAKPTRQEGLPFALATMETDLAAKDRDYYCRMPQGLNDLRKFARQAVEDKEGPVPDQVEIAKRLLGRLKRPEFTYKKPNAGLPRTDSLEAFLLQGHEGDCKQFNSALALMLREFKIPARMILGLKGGKIEDGEFVVRWPGHAWVEAYLNGRWVIMDATPVSTDGEADPNQPQDPPPDDDANNTDPQQNPQKQDQGSKPKKDELEKDDKDGKGKTGEKEKQQDRGKDEGKPSVKNDGTEDDKALEKIAQRQNKKRKPEDQPNDKPKTQPGDKPSDKPGDKPSDKPGDKPSDKPGDKPSDKPGDKP